MIYYHQDDMDHNNHIHESSSCGFNAETGLVHGYEVDIIATDVMLRTSGAPFTNMD